MKGSTNPCVMVLFCRGVAEGKQVIEEMARHGSSGQTVENFRHVRDPNNAIEIDAFATRLHGFSIDSYDLDRADVGR